MTSELWNDVKGLEIAHAAMLNAMAGATLKRPSGPDNRPGSWPFPDKQEDNDGLAPVPMS